MFFMKPISSDKFQPNIRQIANNSWGGDCQSIKTNRNGAYYYSCSAHGGYVVKSLALSKEERTMIDAKHSPEMLPILVQKRKDGDFVIAVDYGKFNPVYRRRKISYNPSLGSVEWRGHPMYLFEEDEEWSILEHYTDIRLKEDEDDPKHDDVIRRSFETWHSGI